MTADISYPRFVISPGVDGFWELYLHLRKTFVVYIALKKSLTEIVELADNIKKAPIVVRREA